ncbi:aminotransferase class V-fold PLP-dependent enzyme (plasmid) [Aminobacter sp. NyZ550]|jgi:alanine-glyoxylate transaminase/serine-glyoxylate transaminase/serine-pyruvate transaminase|uniref:Serine--glyoxylate aminotransferase n=2 Tax=Aminobacter TaxID=31988 RepID=A0AAC8YUF4_AMIAI|nr:MULTISPECIES: aminotransferase class V-fold PLP-dependent enzyme [Aminobacter]AMS44690.1 serine--glyoxylate aminotransferase [Aminobacter aminovorans]MBA8906839.1 alanine-glyoxylate transaminase/serine-glyoxylate transaminase/serine-pyruvate transaminase [Aminobacter ciceronei]MBA9020903.1 alanine-glyoxylate transaminase/serine-glyoxylate transaminase/serine-pyruvate transaminase [Aminobacter ciceronei]MBB3704517.1 alanine-glyoxylate transaminase/serine-glyoxylate transaminase/serine-pyruvat
MAGFNQLFVPGPTNVPESVRQAMNMPMEDMRAPDYPTFTRGLFTDLMKVFRNETGRAFIFPSSGTGAWESAITNTLSPGDRVLMSRFGQFSHLWVDMAERFGLDVDVVDVEWGTGVPVEIYAERLAADKEHRIKAVFVTHNETATGVTSDVGAVRAALNAAKHPALLFVDGVSSVGSIDFRQEEWGVDCAVSGSQKGFMLPPGLGFLSVSQKALNAAKTAKFSRCYFSFEDQIRANDTGYFPYTPAVQLLRGLRAALDLIQEEGLDNIFERHHRLATGVRKAVDAWGLRVCAKEAKWNSDTVSAIVVPEGIDSADIVRRAYNGYQTSLGVGLNKVAGKVFRIGHLGWVNEVMMCGAISAAEMSLRDCGVKVQPGSGVGAALEHYRLSAQPAVAKAA